jgi:polysaccharide pyruvyl transferase WcaK-like protein
MTRIIYGASGYNNLGDEAILDSLINKYNSEKLHIFSGNPNLIKNKYNFDASKPSILPILKCKTLTIGGGGIFFNKIIKYFLIFGYVGLIFKKNIEFVGIGVTPLNKIYQKITSFLLNHSNYISVRDNFSKKLLLDYGVKKNIEVVDDPAESIELYSGNKIPQKFKGNNKYIFISAKFLLKKDKINLSEENITFINGMAKVLDKVIDLGHEIIFIPFCYPKNNLAENDLVFYKKLSKKMKNKMDYFKSDNPQIIKSILSKGKLLIGMRLHSLILGNKLESKKIIALSYDPKVSSYAEKKNISYTNLSNFNKDNFYRKIIEKLND